VTGRAGLVYLDASALVKLVAEERESGALAAFLSGHCSRVSSVLARVEVIRAVGRSPLGRAGRRRAEEVLARVALVHLSDEIMAAAGNLRPPDLRSLDALHLATALSLETELEGFVAYDTRLLAAATARGLTCWSPG
jgi:predicted nucleic acid-binding protein